MGHRNIPHFVIAILHETPDGGRYVLRATIDSEVLDRQVHGLIGSSTGDAFIVNQGGILQTPSLSCGGVLQNCNISIPPQSQQVDVVESVDSNSNAVILGFARIEKSPFIVVLRNHPSATQESWLSLRRELVGFLVISILLIVGVVVWGSWRMVNRTRDSDRKRAAIFHKMEYTNKMASIGRLAAGVAHEINNPLAIINEKAGLLKDLYSFSEQSPDREKVLGIIDSVLRSVERCGNITHRLLGFAKHMDVHNEDINLKTLLDEVLSFLGKESVHRGLTVNFEFSGTPPTIQSDRGQLQQVFLNIINNAFAAVEDGGQIDLSIVAEGTDHVVVGIADNGSGIPQEHLSRIFEPFFTTKKEYGTGLGLSITYGIVQKLGGKISVTSKVGTGTEFRITLPRKRNPQGEA
jgi:signal transduction histidine kinase